MSWQRLLLGDWGRWIRDPLDLARLGFLVAAVVALVLGDLSDAVRLALTCLLLALARWLDLPRPFDLALIVGMFLQAFGNAAGLFASFGPYDVIVHFVLSLAVAPCLYLLCARFGVVPDLADAERHHQLGIFLITFAFGLALGALYEMYEWVSNHALGGHLHVGYSDTIADLLDDAIASLCGGALLVLWAHRGWPTTRRLPRQALTGERRAR
jgi:hypothetical protein